MLNLVFSSRDCICLQRKIFYLNSPDFFFKWGKDLMTLLNLKLSEDQPFPRPHCWHGYYPNLKILAKRNVVIGSLCHTCVL